MDRRETMPMPSSAPLYMQRGLSELHGPQGVTSLPNSGMPFQSNVMGNSSGPGLVLDPLPTLLPDGLGVGPASLQLSATPIRRKRGRPRKYGPNGGRVSLALSSISASPRGVVVSAEKRGRGRPPGSGRKQQLAPFGRLVSSSAGVGFTPHVITMETGEDIAAKILAFAQQGSRAVCVLSANGAVSTLTLRQPSTSCGTITYEGRYDILSMSGSFLLDGHDSSHERSGGLSISLASPDGSVIGGGVDGMLIAASPVQVIVGSFIWTNPNTAQNSQKGTEGGGDSLQYSVDSTGLPPSSQIMIPTSSSMGAAWQTLDMRNSQVDIDLRRG